MPPIAPISSRLPYRSIRLIGILLLAVVLVASNSMAQFQQATTGVVDIEAEGFTSTVARGSHAWESTTATVGFSGAGAMVALPNNGTNINANWTTTSPELRYDVTFTQTGTHYVWMRGYAATDNDDSAHVSLNSGTGDSAARISLPTPTTASWRWTRSTINSGNPPASINVPSAAVHPLSLYMREDGLIVDRILLTPNDSFSATTGNAWHIPDNAELGGIPSMRFPFNEILAGTDVVIYNGNQFQGSGGNPGNQFQTGSLVKWRKVGESGWQSAAMSFHSQSGNNKYFVGTIPGTSLNSDDEIEYYIKAVYDDHLPTYLYGKDSNSNATETESVAQASPYSFLVDPPQPALEPTGSFASFSQGQFEARVYENEGHLSLLGPSLDGKSQVTYVTFAPPSARINGRTQYVGALVARAERPDGLELQQLLGGETITAQFYFAHDGVLRYEVTNWGNATPTSTSVLAASPDDEHFYGFGEKFNNFDQAGRRIHMLNLDIPGPKGDAAYKVIPWFLSTRGYGFHLDSSAQSTFDMRNAASDRYSITNPYPELKINIVAGPKLTAALERFTAYTGRPPLPPEWSFGVWISTDHWRTGGEVRYAVEKLVALGIPTSAIVFDSPWEIAYNDFTWNLDQFDDGGVYEGQSYAGFASISEMMDFLRSHGLKVVCWMTPFVNVTSNIENVPGQNLGQASNYAEGAANGFFVRSSPGGSPLVVEWWKGSGSPIDFTNPAAVTWLQEQLQQLVDGSRVSTSSGKSFPVIGGFKTDDGEAATGGGREYIPASASYFDGRTGVEMANAYAFEYHKTVWNVLGNDGVLFARSGFTGSAAFPAYWSGDNEPNFSPENGLPSVIVAGQSAAMSGLSMWAHDVGGYIDSNYESNRDNLFMRWSQFGALSPLMQLHRQVGSGRQYPWSYSAAALDNYRACAQLHSRLFPYLYSYAKISSETGLPILRPLVLLHQDDPNVWGINHTFCLGDELLVAPFITLNATSRDLYLPSGNWYDYWTDAPYTGGQIVNWSNPDQSKFPLFVRAGSFVPMLLESPQSLCPAEYVDNAAISTRGPDLDILTIPAAQFAFHVYDGTAIEGLQHGDSLTISYDGPARPVQFRIVADEPPAVSRDGVAIPRAASEVEYHQSESSWYYGAKPNRVWVKFPHAGGATSLLLGIPSTPTGAAVR